MRKLEIMNRYSMLNEDLASIALSFGTSVNELIKSFPSRSDEVRNKMRPILEEQVYCLEELRSLDLINYENVKVLRISKFYSL